MILYKNNREFANKKIILQFYKKQVKKRRKKNKENLVKQLT